MAEQQVRGLRLHVQRLGAGGRPVVFLHGLVMDNLSSWFFTAAPSVARANRVLLYDLRGHGMSERPSTGYDLAALVDELVGLLDAEGLDRARLVGHSFGGTLALATALLAPTRVSGLVLLDALVPEPGWGERMAATLSLDGDARDGVIATRFADWLGRHSDRKRTRLERQARALVGDTSLIADLRASPGWPVDAFRSVDVPALLINGSLSDVRPEGERLAAALPRSEVRWIDGTHSLLWERTDEVKSHIAGWLDG